MVRNLSVMLREQLVVLNLNRYLVLLRHPQPVLYLERYKVCLLEQWTRVQARVST